MLSWSLELNFILFIIGLLGILTNRKSILHIIMAIELVLLSLNLNFILFSASCDESSGVLFTLFILTVAAAESALGLALLIGYYRVRGNITLNNTPGLKG
jgi:NADH-quinone oxidoreductase subunit K